jgi:hypothetical protein
LPSEPWTTALISLSSATVGALLGGGVTQFLEWLKERQHRGRVATALLSEVLEQADFVATCASLASFAEHGLPPGSGVKPAQITNWLPPEPSAYRSLAGQLPLLPPSTVSATIAFHGSVAWAKTVSTVRVEGEAFAPDQVLALGNAWRAAALTSVRALAALLKRSSATLTDTDNQHIALLVADLQAAIRNEWPRVDYNKETGRMSIGPSWAENRRRAA